MQNKVYRFLRLLYHAMPLPLKLKGRIKAAGLRLITLMNFKLKIHQTYIKKVIKPTINRAEMRVEKGIDGFIQCDKPKVSIIIPVYNNLDYTLRCLASILNETKMRDFEVIVVDDCSTDNTEAVLRDLTGIKYLKNEVNAGFIETCNNGADVSSGEYLVFLNNDTVVIEGWLEKLLEVFKDNQDAGLVGSMLIYPDGRLQEAGGIVWNDASAWNVGRLSSPMKPEYNYLRKVDYCSGACVCIQSSVFKSVGGFDRRYIPAYYEDTDLAFKMWELGRVVYYQPESKVIHFEGVSSGTDLTSGMKKYQVVNQEKFFEVWRNRLKSFKPNGVDFDKQKDRGANSYILIIDACLPTPDKDSGSVRMFELIRLLCSRNDKVVFIPSNLEYDEKYTKLLQKIGVEVMYLPYIASINKFLKTKGAVFDTVLLSRVNIADIYMDDVRKYCPRATVVFDTVDLHFIRERRQAIIEGDQVKLRKAEEQKKLELDLLMKSDMTLVVSELEKKVLENELKEMKLESESDIDVLSNIHKVYGRKNEFNDRSGILFIGGFNHTPNIDAVEYFCSKVFPEILLREPDMVFYVIGSHVPGAVKKLASENIKIVGYVDDIQEYFEKVRISIAPLRYGAGVKGKINSSMSYGVPVVSTSIGVEGMGLIENEEVLIADEPVSFADAVIKLYTDADLWEKLSVGGARNIDKHFSLDNARKVVDRMCAN